MRNLRSDPCYACDSDERHYFILLSYSSIEPIHKGMEPHYSEIFTLRKVYGADVGLSPVVNPKAQHQRIHNWYVEGLFLQRQIIVL